MIRLLLGILLALGLAGAPMAADAQSAIGGHMPKCAMGGAMPDMPDMPADHSKMSCCTVACQAPSAAALLPGPHAAAALAHLDGPRLSWAADRQLNSLPRAALDPPPRA